jgi:galactonate dehydratase
MVFDNPLRQALARPVFGDVGDLEQGSLRVPDAPGLGITIDREALQRWTIR